MEVRRIKSLIVPFAECRGGFHEAKAGMTLRGVGKLTCVSAEFSI